MSKETINCPACGFGIELGDSLPETDKCHGCGSIFKPIDELRRYILHICRPENRDTFLEVYYSGRPFILPRRGDIISRQFEDVDDLTGAAHLRVDEIEIEFSRPVKKPGYLKQNIYITTKVDTE